MLLHNKKIAIIGGGPGGLTLARLLQLKGIDAKVYERDVNKDVRIQGGALDLHEESGLAALTKAGLTDEFKKNFRPGAEKVRVTDENATIYLDQHQQDDKLTFGDKHYRPEIDRGPLRDILLNSLQPGTVIWDSHIVSLGQIENGWKINFQNGDSVTADLIIGADGANSKIRRYVTDIQPVWAGITMIEGSIKHAAVTAPTIHQLLKGGKIFAYGNEKTLLVSSKGDGSLGFATGHKTKEGWINGAGIDFKDNKQVLDWFRNEFAGWDSVWHELFASPDTQFIPRPQYCMPLNLHWEARPDITLIGDAAHWMPPYAGEGVNMAMLDALELSESLTNPAYKTIQQAIAGYEKKMFRRFSKIGEMTMFNTRWMHQKKSLQTMLDFFGDNMFKQAAFVLRMWFTVTLIPNIRRALPLKIAGLTN